MANTRLELIKAIPLQTDLAPNIRISKDGSLIYAVTYPGTGYPTTNPAASLLSNVGNTLTVLSSIPFDPIFFGVNAGDASEDFNLFSILEDDGINTARVRVYRRNGTNLVLLASRSFTDFAANTLSLNGGFFSPDGRFLSVTYIQDSTTNQAVLRILDSRTLQEVASTNFIGFTNGAKFFDLVKCGKVSTYVALPSVQGDFTQATYIFAAPSLFTIYKLSRRLGLKIIDQVSLPQHTQNFTLRNSEDGKKVRIAIGTRRAFLPNEPSIVTPTSNDFSFLPYDGNEFRIYDFNGKRIKYIYSRNINSDTRAVVQFPDRIHFFTAQQNLVNPTSFSGVLYYKEDLDEEHLNKKQREIEEKRRNTVNITLPFIYNDVEDQIQECDRLFLGISDTESTLTASPFSGDISCDGKFLVLGGASDVDRPNLNSIAVYEVIYE